MNWIMRACLGFALGGVLLALGSNRLGAAGPRRPRVLVSSSVIRDGELETLQAAAPGIELVLANDIRDALRKANDAEGAIGFCSVELLNSAPRLRWVQIRSAGVNDLLFENPPLMNALIKRNIIMTNARIIYGRQIADHAMALLLAHTRGIAEYIRRVGKKEWKRGKANPMADGVRPIELTGRTMLIIGFGGIGSQVARRAAAFDMKIYATDPRPIPKPPYVIEIARPADFHRLLPKADVIVSCVPLTPQTKGMIGKREFGLMKRNAILINVSRGKVVDTDAMVEALRNKKLAGAGLDVTDPEPLPSSHPLWDFENVVISPHTAVQSQFTKRRLYQLIEDNLQRFAKGQPMRNVVDKQAGY